MRQRSCRVVLGVNKELLKDLEEERIQDTDESYYDSGGTVNNGLNSGNYTDLPILKMGINLPILDWQWSTANEYFKLALSNEPIKPHDLNSNIKNLNDVIYNYFTENFGQVEKNNDTNMINKYKDLTVKELKKSLKT
jgi:hypothetical protein